MADFTAQSKWTADWPEETESAVRISTTDREDAKLISLPMKYVHSSCCRINAQQVPGSQMSQVEQLYEAGELQNSAHQNSAYHLA